jgi:hypothetical protein
MTHSWAVAEDWVPASFDPKNPKFRERTVLVPTNARNS